MHRSTVTAKGQTTLPRAVRDALGVSAGDRIRYVIDGREVRVVKAEPVSRLAGLLRRDGPAVPLDEMDAAVAAEASARLKRS